MDIGLLISTWFAVNGIASHADSNSPSRQPPSTPDQFSPQSKVDPNRTLTLIAMPTASQHSRAMASLTHHPVPDRSDGKVIVCFRRHLALATCWSEHFL